MKHLLQFFPWACAVLILCGAADPHHTRNIPQAGAQAAVSIIATAAPAFLPLAALSQGAERFPEGAQLELVRAGKAELLLPGFFESADASVSFDATRVIFTGKKYTRDHWQIWEMRLADRFVRKIASADTDLIRPLYLPGDRAVYARRTADGFQMESASLNDSEPFQLTHLHANALPVDVLQDGRILFESGYPLGTSGSPELYLDYSDGSGVESVRCDHGCARWGGRQLVYGAAAGDVVFTHGQTLSRFTSPLATETPVAAPSVEYAGALAETPSGAWVVSERVSVRSRFALALLQPGVATLRVLLADRDHNLVEPAVVAPRPVPNRHPSGLHDWTSANLLALDVRESRDGALSGKPVKVRLDAQNADGSAMTLGYAPVEPDGSFYVTTPGDRPLRFTLLDAHGATLRAERGWFWVRSGEQRICVGCHAGPERAPENRVPEALLRSTIPVNLSGRAPGTAAGGR